MTAIADDEARALIGRDGLDRTLFVEAGAGTGKTTQLVQRIVNLVVVRGVRLADIAAITFTEAAASELQDRIRVEFERRAATTDDPSEAQRCQEAVADADLAAISTLHGFAKRILSEHPVAAGLPPRVDILDEVSSQLAHEDRWVRFVDRLYAEPAREELLVRAALLDVALEPRYGRQATLKEVAATLAQNWDRLEPTARRPVEPLPPLDLSPFADAVYELETIAKDCVDPEDLLFKTVTSSLLPRLRAILDLEDPRWALRALASTKGWSKGRGGRSGAWRRPLADVTQAIAAVNAARSDVVRTASDQVLTRLLTLVSREVVEAAEARRAEGRLEFHDLLVLARRLLRTNPDARRLLHQRYRYLLLDEFQDTDPLQIELAVLISSAVDGDGGDRWSDHAVEAGRLFFVGDPKQSIYRFRRADISLFLEARDRFAPDRSWQRLVTNFRTVGEIVAWNNELFGALMSQEQPGLQPAYEPLVAFRRSADSADHRPVLLGGPQPAGTRAPAAALRAQEADDVAAIVDAIRRDPSSWPVLDPTTGTWRPARLPDITVLVPTRTSLPFLRNAFTASDIPYRLDTGTLVYTTQEIRDLVSALRAIDDPTDELNLVAALRSPLYACSDPDLNEWRRAGGRWDLRQDPPSAIPGEHPVAQGMAHLRSLWDQRWWSSPSALLARLASERRADLLALGHERPAEVWRRLRFLLDQARAFDEAGGGALRDFLDWVELQGSEGARVHEPLLPETDDQAVRVMTVHGSKGLEFPITILSGMTTRPGSPRGGYQVLWDDDGQPQLRVKADVTTDNHDPRADLEEEMDVHEKLRLLYVASTRARDHLVVSCHHNPGDRSYACQVWERCQGWPELWRRVERGNSQLALELDTPPVPPPPVVDERDLWVAQREALLEPQRRPSFVSATTIALETGAVEIGDDGDDDDGAGHDGGDGSFADDVATVATHRRGRAGSAVGRAVHASLQLLDLAQPQDVDALAARQAELEVVPEAAETVAALVRSALAAPSVHDAANRRHHKEVYVAAPVGGRVLEGYVDLLVETPDGLVVIDYKTDTVASDADIEAKLRAYELQAAAYALVLEQTTGLTVADCRFVFCRRGGAVERSVVDLAAAKERVRRHLQR